MEVVLDGWRAAQGIPLAGRQSIVLALHRAFQRVFGKNTEVGPHVVELLTEPGLGATTLLARWLDELAQRARFDKARRSDKGVTTGCRLVIAYDFAGRAAAGGEAWSEFVAHVLARITGGRSSAGTTEVTTRRLADVLATQAYTVVLDGFTEMPDVVAGVSALIAALLDHQREEPNCLLVYAAQVPLTPGTATDLDVEQIRLAPLSAVDGAQLLRSIRGMGPARLDVRHERVSDRFAGHLHSLVATARHTLVDGEREYEELAVFGVSPADASPEPVLVPLARTLGTTALRTRTGEGVTVVTLPAAERLRFVGSMVIDPPGFRRRHQMRWVGAAYSQVWAGLEQGQNAPPDEPPVANEAGGRRRIIYVLSCAMSGHGNATHIHRTCAKALFEHLQPQRRAHSELEVVFDCGAHIDAASAADSIIVLMCPHLAADERIHRGLQALRDRCADRLEVVPIDLTDMSLLAPVQSFTDTPLSGMEPGGRHGVWVRLVRKIMRDLGFVAGDFAP